MKVNRETIRHRFPVLTDVVLNDVVPRVTDAVLAPVITRRARVLLRNEPFPLPHKVELELVNRCNNTCPFCPVNRKVDPREMVRMEDSLFESVIDQLASLGFSGRLALHSNNEPLLDRRIYEFARRAKGALPGALVYLQTNGKRLTLERFIELARSLDRIVINNYDDDLKMIAPVGAVYEYCRNHAWAGDKVTINMKRLNIRRSNRADSAPNRRIQARPMRSACFRPFTEMIIRPDGKLSLCCFDALGRMTLGDLNATGLIDAWNGAAYREVREAMIAGRASLPICATCDEVLLGERLAVVERHGHAANVASLLRGLLGGERTSP